MSLYILDEITFRMKIIVSKQEQGREERREEGRERKETSWFALSICLVIHFTALTNQTLQCSTIHVRLSSHRRLRGREIKGNAKLETVPLSTDTASLLHEHSEKDHLFWEKFPIALGINYSRQDTVLGHYMKDGPGLQSPHAWLYWKMSPTRSRIGLIPVSKKNNQWEKSTTDKLKRNECQEPWSIFLLAQRKFQAQDVFLDLTKLPSEGKLFVGGVTAAVSWELHRVEEAFYQLWWG